jgi:presenilin-like A22 family membrane protease
VKDLNEEAFKARLAYLIPIAFSLVTSGLLTLLVSATQVELPSVGFFSEEGAGPFLNGLLFVLAMAAAGTLVLILIRHRSWRFLEIMFAGAFALATYFLTIVYGQAFLTVLGAHVNGMTLWVHILGGLSAGVATYSIFISASRVQVFVALVFGAALGAFLGVSTPTLSAIALFILLIMYDVFTVYHGPVGKIASQVEPERLKGVSLTFGKVHMGMGDIVFYSMLVSHMFFVYGVNSLIASSFGTLIGVYAGLKLLERRSMFPGLPLALALGLLAGLAVSL